MAIVSGPETQVNSYTNGDQDQSSVTALSNGGWAVTWYGSGNIFQQVYDADGRAYGGEMVVAVGGREPQSTALANGGWVVTWISSDLEHGAVVQQTYGADGAPLGPETRVSGYPTGTFSHLDIATLANGGWVVTWQQDYGRDVSDRLYQRAFNADGTAYEGVVKVNSFPYGGEFDPHVTALADGGWVVTWTSSNHDVVGLSVYQQAYNANGTVRGGEVRVNTYFEGDQSGPQTTALIDGGWVVTWVSNGQDGSGLGVFQQAYNTNGSVRGGEVQVNTHTAGLQSYQQTTALTDGGWVVTWVSADQDSSSWGIYQQIYNANGTAHGVEVRVNTYVTDNQSNPQIAALTDGGWVVTWNSAGQDGSGGGVYLKAYNADGSAQGDEVQVNTYVTGYQHEAKTAALPDGGWVVTWTSQYQDGSGMGIYQREFHFGEIAPSGTDKSIGVAEDGFHTFSAGDFGFTDGDGNKLAAVIVKTLPGNGTLTLNGHSVSAGQLISAADLGGLVWKPNANAHGVGLSSFTFQVVDDGRSPNIDQSPNTITFNVANVNDAPIGAVTINGATVEGGLLTASNSLSDADGLGTISYQWQRNGHDIGGATGTTYALTHDDVGSSITVVAHYIDGQGTDESVASAATAGVAKANEAPIAADDTATVFEYATVNGNVLFGAGADHDADGVTLSVSQVSGASGSFLAGASVAGRFGALILLANGNFSYLADNAEALAAGQSGVDVFTYTVSDGKGGMDTATLTINVSGTNTGTAGDNHLQGTDAAESFFGDAGSDVVDARGGDDILDGGTGFDFLIGGSGNDTYVLGGENDSVVDVLGTDTITTTISRSLASYTGIENLTLLGSSNVNATGNAFANMLTGNAEANVLNGGVGADNMRGGAGNDVYVVDNASDIINESLPGSNGIDTVQSSISFNLANTTRVFGAIENLALLGSGSISGTGNALNNVITGNAGANVLNGAAGNDTLNGGGGNDGLYGGAGKDTLAGGGGYDTFVFNTPLSASSNVDRITDFNVVQDTIRLENAVMPGLGPHVGTLYSTAFWKSTTGLAHDSNDRIIYETDTGWLNYDSNGSGAGGAVHIAQLAPNLALTHADFFVI